MAFTKTPFYFLKPFIIFKFLFLTYIQHFLVIIYCFFSFFMNHLFLMIKKKYIRMKWIGKLILFKLFKWCMFVAYVTWNINYCSLFILSKQKDENKWNVRTLIEKFLLVNIYFFKCFKMLLCTVTINKIITTLTYWFGFIVHFVEIFIRERIIHSSH